MVEIQKTKMKTSKKILLAFIILMIPIILLTLVLMGSCVIYPIVSHFEHQRFITLNQEAQKIYSAIKSIAPSDEDWKYGTGCDSNRTGDLPDGTFTCVAISYLEIPVTSAAQAQAINDRYFNLFENRSNLITYRETTISYSFDKEFTVGDISKEYTETKSNADCIYDAFLGQTIDSTDPLASERGSRIIDDKGMLTVALRCEDKSNDPWYTEVKSVYGIVPDFSPKI